MSIKKLASQTATYGVTTIIVRFINYFLTPYFTNLAIFTPEVYGVMNYYYAIIPFGLTLLSMGLETGYFRFVGKSASPQERQKVFNTLTSTIALISIIFFAVVFCSQHSIYELLDGEKAGNIAIIPIVGAIIALDAISAMPYARLRADGQTTQFMKAKIVNVLINLLLCLFFYSLLPLLVSKGIFASIWNPSFGSGYVFVANLIASFVTLLFLKTTLNGFKFSIDGKLLKTILIFSLSLFISGLNGTANEFLDRQLLYFLLPASSATAQIGLYSAAMKIAAFIYLFTQMYRFAAEPYFLSEVKESDFSVRNAEALKYFTIASLAIFLFIMLFMDYFQYFVGKDFREGLKVVPILLLSNILMGLYLNISYWYKVSEKTIFAILITFVGLVVTVLLNVALIGKYGYEGSAWARLGCQIVMVLLSYFLGQKYMAVSYDFKAIAKYVVVAGVLYGGYNILNFEGIILKTVISILFFSIFVLYFIYEERLFKRLRK